MDANRTEDLASGANSTTRRQVVKTGVRLAYTAPLLAATFQLTAMNTAAQVGSGGVINCIPGACIPPVPINADGSNLVCGTGSFDGNCIVRCRPDGSGPFCADQLAVGFCLAGGSSCGDAEAVCVCGGLCIKPCPDPN